MNYLHHYIQTYQKKLYNSIHQHINRISNRTETLKLPKGDINLFIYPT